MMSQTHEGLGGLASHVEHDHLFKLLLVGDSGVGKSCLLLRFTTDTFDDLSPTIGVDFKLKSVVVNGKHVKLTIWDTAGQERFRTLTSSYYRGAQGVILVYDVTRRETFSSLAELWLKEVDMYSNVPACVLMLVANKTDQESARQVSREEGIEFARQCGSLFLECSAKTRVNVQQCFSELVQKILETPALTNPKPSASNSGIISSLHPSPSTNEGEGCLC